MEPNVATLQLLKDAISIMIPVVTGFVALFGATLGKIWEWNRGRDHRQEASWRLAAATFGAAVLSLWTCFGAMGIIIKASTGQEGDVLWFAGLSSEELARAARYYLYAAYTLFGGAIAFAALFFNRLVSS